MSDPGQSPGRGRLWLAIAAVPLLWAIWHYGLAGTLSLANLKARVDGLYALRDQSPLLVIGGFFLLYVLVTGLSLPGAAILSLAAGALFGLEAGTVIVSFASSIGATLAMLSSRYLFRDAVMGRFGDRLQPVMAGMARDGPWYLFALRLAPVFPFFVINLLMGLTPISAFTFYWVSQIGMLAGTLVYVNAGTQLAHIDSLSGIASPGLLASFAALGLFPLLARWLAGKLRRR